ncbi:Crp/Fnr family transcriptional regulator [Nitrosomonas supralitoralis]|uniref:Crp/Fnr family transcriptional regulator n=1 Tax=Nitrosomonas supralitoralis TaxID=2116706 RepID=A0A2P7NXK1_9PROT|nr:Crp/Fnr family transcriptional regulator [Nitrosomonas supralitoralis]PSJ18193.1 Crp/Fnr family transcriptional regulator [Nitrosomonas supralitoralis]
MSLSVESTNFESMARFFENNFNQLRRDYPSIQEVNLLNKDFLYRQGEYCGYIFWIKRGIVKLSHLTAQGSEITIALLKSRDVIGDLSSDIQTKEETAQALGEVSCYRMTFNDFKALLSQQTILAWQIFEETYARKQKIEQKLRTILTQPVEMCLAAALLELAEMFGVRCTHGYALEIHLTQQDVADLIGASRSVVSTILNDFRSRGMLEYTRDQICVNDAALADYCEAK